MIVCQNISRSFRTYLKEPGLSGALHAFWKRRYQDVWAVNDFCCEVQQGEILGLLGPNGAGKTTLMKMLTGIITPTRGAASVLGFNPAQRRNAYKKQMALAMGQKSQLWWDLPAFDSFQLLQSYYEIPEQQFKERLSDLVERLDVGALLQAQVRKLSLGERMKMELIACLLHNPKVLFLDEPTIGLDVSSQKIIREFLREYHKTQNTTIVLTSHYMADVAALCERICLIVEGRKRFDGTTGAFERLLGNEKFVTVTFGSSPPQEDLFLQRFHPAWDDDGCSVHLRIPEAELRSVAAALMQNYPVLDFSSELLPLERVMEQLINNPALLPAA